MSRKTTLIPGYELKLNSYDLGVDIKLYDAVQRLRFEHPEVGAVVVTSSKDRVFCAGANIKMLSQSGHGFKMNFCKFTNETRNAMEDASANSGQTYICATNGPAAGGGYELALACEHILLIDDGSSTVSLPELPMLAVLPGTGGLTRLVDKRNVRHDHADFLCTTSEGVRGKRALEWRLVDELTPRSNFDQAVAEKASEVAQRSDRPESARGIELIPLMREAIAALNQWERLEPVQRHEIPALAKEYITPVEPLTQKVEEFVLASIEEGWSPGVQLGLRVAGDLISLSERRTGGLTIRLAQGVPALLAWRLLILSGPKALAEEVFDLLGTVLVGSIEVENQSGRFNNRPFLQRRDLFHPEAFFGHADSPNADYIAQLWTNHPHLHRFFNTEQHYHFSVAKFLMVVALTDPANETNDPLYPGYRLLPEAGRAMSSLCSKLASSDEYLEGMARAIGESADQFRGSWSQRVNSANAADLGSRYFPNRRVRFPDPLDSDLSEC